MVSMKDIARECGVSIATVSKALNGHNDIGDDTRKRICSIARDMGYFPNSSARALKTKRTYSIGVLFVDVALSGLTHDYFSHVLDSFKRYAENKGYDITFINAGNSMTYLEHSRYRGFDGVVIACVDFLDPRVLELVQSDLPVVTIDHVFDNRISVVSDNIGGMHDLIQHIYNNGHRKIAYIHGDDTAVTRNRIASYYQTIRALGLKENEQYVRESSYRNPEDSYRLTGELLALKNPPTCIIYSDDYSCIGGLNKIKELGLSVPADISVAGYDGIYISQIIDPKLTTVAQDTESIGSVAAKELIRLIEDPRGTLIEKITVPCHIITGESVGPIKK